jgi:hypothetical protein
VRDDVSLVGPNVSANTVDDDGGYLYCLLLLHCFFNIIFNCF